MKRSMAIITGLTLLVGLVWIVAAGRDTAVGHYTEISEKSVELFNNETIVSQNIELLSQIGGSASAVTIEGNYVYVGMGSRLFIFDIVSNQPDPLLVGQTDILPGDVMEVAVTSGYAYVATNDGSGNSPLVIIDISDSSNPFLVGNYDTLGSVENLVISGSYAYIADGVDGLRILDISNPAHLTEVGFYDTPDSALNVVLDGNYVYIADKSSLRVIDVSDKANPTEAGFFIFSTSAWVDDLTMSNASLYVGVGSDLFILDVSDPVNPSQIGAYTAYAITDVEVSGSYAYIVGYCGLDIVDISDQSNPQQAEFYAITASTWALALAGDHAYVANSMAGLKVIDISDPLIPTAVSSYATHPGKAYNLDIANNFAYILNGVGDICSANLQIMDVSNPVQPIAMGSYTSFKGMQTVAASGAFAFVVDGHGQIIVLDISDPAHPTDIYNISLSGAVKALEIVDDIAYIVDSTGFRILDVADPINYVELGFFANSYGDDAVIRVQNGYAYVADANGLSVINVLDFANPTEIGIRPAAWSYVSSVDVADNFVYIVTGWHDGFLRILDVSDPTSPTEINSVGTSGTAAGVTIANDLVYVADGESGLRTFNVANPSNITEIGYYDTPGFAYDVAVVDDNIYIADSGLFTLKFFAISSIVTPIQGGTLVFSDTQNLPTTIQVPPGAVTDTTTLVYTPLMTPSNPSDLLFAGHAFDLAAYQSGLEKLDFNFQQPVTVTIHYSDADVASVGSETQLILTYWDGNDWVDAATTCTPISVYNRDMDNNILSVPICHLSSYALFGAEAQKVYLPIVIR